LGLEQRHLEEAIEGDNGADQTRTAKPKVQDCKAKHIGKTGVVDTPEHQLSQLAAGDNI